MNWEMKSGRGVTGRGRGDGTLLGTMEGGPGGATGWLGGMSGLLPTSLTTGLASFSSLTTSGGGRTGGSSTGDGWNQPVSENIHSADRRV